MISIIAATGKNRELGADNRLLWKLSADMKRFKELTTGHTVIMGRRTFESLPKGALPNRTNVVISKNPDAYFDNCETVNSLTEALNNHIHEDEIFVIGGASVYKQALSVADKIYLTNVHHEFPQADVFFPQIPKNKWVMIESEDHSADKINEFPYSFTIFIRKK